MKKSKKDFSLGYRLRLLTPPLLSPCNFISIDYRIHLYSGTQICGVDTQQLVVFIRPSLLIDKTPDIIDRAIGKAWTCITCELAVPLVEIHSSDNHRDG